MHCVVLHPLNTRTVLLIPKVSQSGPSTDPAPVSTQVRLIRGCCSGPRSWHYLPILRDRSNWLLLGPVSDLSPLLLDLLRHPPAGVRRHAVPIRRPLCPILACPHVRRGHYRAIVSLTRRVPVLPDRVGGARLVAQSVFRNARRVCTDGARTSDRPASAAKDS